MVENKSIVEQLKEFHNIIYDLENIEVEIEDEDNTLLLLILLPISCVHFKDVIPYGKEGTITLNEIQMIAISKEFSKVKDLNIDDIGEGLSITKE